MSKSRVVLQPAYVIHSRPYRDTSALLELFTPEYGRVGLIAKGIRSAGSKLRLIIQPFSPLLVSWSGKGELVSLNTAESQGRVKLLKAEALACGLYINELIMRLTHRDEPQIELFSIYDVSLRELGELAVRESENIRLQQILRHFEVNLLNCLGYGLVLEQEAGGYDRVRSEIMYDFQLENGPVAYNNPLQQTYGIKISGKTLLALAHNRLPDHSTDLEVYKEAKYLLRFVLDRYLGNKPLTSRQLLRGKSTIPNADH